MLGGVKAQARSSVSSDKTGGMRDWEAGLCCLATVKVSSPQLAIGDLHLGGPQLFFCLLFLVFHLLFMFLVAIEHLFSFF